MSNHGVKFEIPNQYGSFLADILEMIPFAEYKWLIDDDEIHLVENSELADRSLFSNEERIMLGEPLFRRANSSTYYMIFVTLKGFFPDDSVQPIRTYREFLESECQIVLVVSDCSYVFLWCKDTQLITHAHDYAISKGYEGILYADEDDLIAEKYRLY